MASKETFYTTCQVLTTDIIGIAIGMALNVLVTFWRMVVFITFSYANVLPGAVLGDGDAEMNETRSLPSRTARSSGSSTRAQVITTVCRALHWRYVQGTSGVRKRNHSTESGGARGAGNWGLS